ncbi:MAG: patatin-like phospholipase family protein, partial [Alphaproteobacteria bacterium]|nr:patatin-like phospholipase family protein [Alphaproteobacteria bacterium]
MADEAEFEIGLAMSGAISAGAYTAGVFDFLIQALDEWEKVREEPNVPNHRVGLKVMSGASAGAITAAIGAVALAEAEVKPANFDENPPIPADPSDRFLTGIKCYLPRLYKAWVEQPGLVAEGGEQADFLQTSDLDAPPKPADDFSRTQGIPPNEENPQPVVSLLNTRLLDAIAKAAIEVDQTVSGEQRRAYISETLHVYLTLSNLRGIPYAVPFGADPNNTGRENQYHMISHGDRVHYAVEGLGRWSGERAQSFFANQDQKRVIEAANLRPQSTPPDSNWKDYAVCTLASAAFPVGLSPRLIGATLGTDPVHNEYDGRRIPIAAFHGSLAQPPAWQPSVIREDPFWFTTADGGIIDNDPFEYAHFSLKKQLHPESSEPSGELLLEDHLPSALSEVDRAVIMISPFPELKPIAPQGKPTPDILSIFSTLMPALIDQARFKPDEIIRAANPKYGSRYLIGPSRVTSDGKEQRFGIASGLLGGFGGFVTRSFRDHDYQLGRRNCQRFLQTAFTLPENNPIILSWKKKGINIEDYKATQTEEEKKRGEPPTYYLIPLFGSAKDEVLLPAWPQISQERFEALQERIAERFDGIAPRLLGQYVNGALWLLLWLAVKRLPPPFGLIRNRALDFVRAYFLADLVRRDQIEGWELPEPQVLEPHLGRGDARLVFGELI